MGLDQRIDSRQRIIALALDRRQLRLELRAPGLSPS
jgi:hypothetical protein